MIDEKIAFIGVGHIAQALIQGILHAKVIAGDKLFLANPHLGKLKGFQRDYKVKLTTDNIAAAKWADILIICVRPKIVKAVIKEIKDYFKKDSLMIVVAACVTFTLLEKYFQNNKVKVIRLMPNIPVAYGMGVIGWVGNKKSGGRERKLVETLFNPLGVVVACKNEKELDRIDIISGCGPGIVAYFIHTFEKAARQYGFSEDATAKMIYHVFAGTLHHMKHTRITAADLISAVATKGGITEEVVRSLDERKFYQIFEKSINNGYAKIGKITDELRKT